MKTIIIFSLKPAYLGYYANITHSAAQKVLNSYKLSHMFILAAA